MRILLIEDDPDLGRGILDGLESVGYHVHWLSNGDDGLYQAQEWDWEVIILDRMLPGTNGMEVLRQLRRKKSVPVLMLTALNTLKHRVEGLDVGADDYLGKPFEFAELIARVRALARRTYGPVDEGVRLKGKQFRLDNGRVFCDDEDLRLSSAEFKTLEYLLLRRGRIVSRRKLEDLLAADGGDILPNTLDVHMHRLRSKIGRSLIETRRGQGYIISEDQ